MSRLGQRAIDALRAYEKAEKATGFDPAPGPSRSRGSSRPRTTIPSPRAKKSPVCCASRRLVAELASRGRLPAAPGLLQPVVRSVDRHKIRAAVLVGGHRGDEPEHPHHQEHRTHEQDRCLDRGGEQGTTLGRLYGIAETLCLTQKLYTSESH
ncbi:conserved hypothetical protein (plasmid) [Rhodococcus jostii RHA1]|uniref:Uncharacterized protein n=2 Tax=Rhodococcus TaxID=1827 RepID=Q0RZ29_RHOJR|nr:conserved hypothetical protein [Rhodococcus jostii RHA1]EID78293.1 hypothetical protein W59_19288 [Rhodococcus opacus RKJ300 = JCM 13270]